MLLLTEYAASMHENTYDFTAAPALVGLMNQAVPLVMLEGELSRGLMLISVSSAKGT